MKALYETPLVEAMDIKLEESILSNHESFTHGEEIPDD